METYPVAGMDVHQKMLAVVVTDAAQAGEYHFERHKFGTGAEELRLLAAWLGEQGVMRRDKPAWSSDGRNHTGKE